MRATFLQSVWVMIRALSATAGLACRAVILSGLGLLTRARADQMLRAWAPGMLRHPQIHLQVKGLSQLHLEPGRAHIMMCNHSSLYDIPVIFAAFPDYSIRMMGKKELFQIPIFGRAMRAGEFLSIDRKNRERAFADLELARQTLQDGIILWTAPEGTRSLSGQLQPFKKGVFVLAISTKAVIIPVCIEGAERVLPAKAHQFNLGETVTVNILPSVDAQDYTLEKKEQLMQVVRERFKTVQGAHLTS